MAEYNGSAFDFLLGKYLSGATEHLNGTIEVETNYMFSTQIMDTGFAFSTTAISEIKTYLANLGYYDINRVFIFTALMSHLKRTNTSMKNESKLFLVQCSDGSYNALYFTGCSIEDSP